MPFARPSLAALRDRIRADIASRFPGADTTLRHNNLRVTAAVIAGASNEDLAYLDWQFRQLFPDTAEGTYLERWAAIWGVTRTGAVRATGTVTVSGLAGTAVPQGARLRRGDGVELELTAAGEVGGGGTATIAARALVGGASGATDVTTPLTFVTTPAGLSDQAVVAAALTGGTDLESDASLLRRTLLRIQAPAHGGNGSDWTQWCLAVAGVTRVWVSAGTPMAGGVTIYPLFDDLRAAENGIPQGDDAVFRPHAATIGSGDQRLVLDALLDLRPVTASVFVTALVPVALDVTVSGLAADTAAVRDAIETELADMLYRRAAPGATISRSWIGEAVSRAAGEDRHVLVSPAADVAVAAGEIVVPGTLTVDA
jgi:uncharacterized phage protein gp47/JayE